MKVLVGLSGGVDSAAAALVLKKSGHEVEGAVLVMHEYTEICAAKSVADSLGIPLHAIDCRESFDGEIKSNFASEYAHGRTPNPCIICNERVKFRGLYDFALKNGFDRIATGHYADIVSVGRKKALRRAADAKKDQTYMLYRLPQHVLDKLVFPLSAYTKPEIRAMMREGGYEVAERSDSQEICFLPDGDYVGYIEEKYGKFPHGDFISESGERLGEHKGIIRYTVGQRKGLGIALGERMFVTAINPAENTVTLAKEMSGKTEIMLSDTVVSGAECSLGESFSAFVKVRYTAPIVPCEITILDGERAKISFNEPVKAAAGQSAVAYDGEGRVLLGGFIE